MTPLGSLTAFLAAATLLTITPGLDTALVLRTLTSSGARPALLAAAGVALGCLAWGGLVAVGLGAVLAASTVLFDALRALGAAYLLAVGLRLLVRPRRGLPLEPSADASSEDPRRAFRRGFLTNVLNPKVGVFYVSFLPQFIPPGTDPAAFSFLLAAVHSMLGLTWFAILVAMAAPLTRSLRSPRVVAFLNRLTGAVFVGFGIRLAFAPR